MYFKFMYKKIFCRTTINGDRLQTVEKTDDSLKLWNEASWEMVTKRTAHTCTKIGKKTTRERLKSNPSIKEEYILDKE